VVAVATAFFAAVSDDSRSAGMLQAGGILAVYVVALLIHEGAHAWTARQEGMTVDGITVSAFGGVTRYSGVDPGPRAVRRIALAGPKASLSAMLASLGLAAGASAAGWHSGSGALAAWSVEVNLLLGVINLLPVGTLDGAAARQAKRRAATAARSQVDPLPKGP
jgi:Zn-dependent protease